MLNILNLQHLNKSTGKEYRNTNTHYPIERLPEELLGISIVVNSITNECLLYVYCMVR